MPGSAGDVADLGKLMAWMRPRARRTMPPEPQLMPLKRHAIDAALEAVEVESIADLGAVWAVEAGYTFYALNGHLIQRAYIVDETIPQSVRTRASADPRVQVITGKLGDPAVAERLHGIDLILMFDILLHQVRPDWDEMLRMYAGSTTAVAIVNPQWTGSDNAAMRLIDLGREDYERNVPDMPLHRTLFDRLDDTNPERGRTWRDVHDVWQWGITDTALHRVMRELGFSIVHEESGNRWQALPNFVDRAFVFVRR